MNKIYYTFAAVALFAFGSSALQAEQQKTHANAWEPRSSDQNKDMEIQDPSQESQKESYSLDNTGLVGTGSENQRTNEQPSN